MPENLLWSDYYYEHRHTLTHTYTTYIQVSTRIVYTHMHAHMHTHWYKLCVLFQLTIIMTSIQSWKVTPLYILLLINLLGEHVWTKLDVLRFLGILQKIWTQKNLNMNINCHAHTPAENDWEISRMRENWRRHSLQDSQKHTPHTFLPNCCEASYAQGSE